MASASSAGQPVAVDPASGIIAFSAPAGTPAGTVQQLDVQLTDGRVVSFAVQVA